jgi:hypothetical protein
MTHRLLTGPFFSGIQSRWDKNKKTIKATSVPLFWRNLYDAMAKDASQEPIESD